MSKPIDQMTRAELVEHRAQLTQQFRVVRAALGTAMRRARAEGIFMNHVQFNELRARETLLHGLLESVAAQFRALAAAKDTRTSAENNFNAAFVQATKEIFDDDEIAEICERATEIIVND